MNHVVNLLMIILLVSCSPGPCDALPTSFTTSVSASNAIQEASFQVEEQIDNNRSSWIRGAKYLSCNGEDGYLLIETDRVSYIHSGVPRYLWENFKAAPSLGRFYNTNLKGQYQLNLKI